MIDRETGLKEILNPYLQYSVVSFSNHCCDASTPHGASLAIHLIA